MLFLSFLKMSMIFCFSFYQAVTSRSMFFIDNRSRVVRERENNTMSVTAQTNPVLYVQRMETRMINEEVSRIVAPKIAASMMGEKSRVKFVVHAGVRNTYCNS